MPTVTIPITANADDDTIERTGTTYPPTGTIDRYGGAFGANQAGRSFISPTYYVRVGLLRFNTSAYLPNNAVISAASLRLAYANRNWLDSPADYEMTADFYQWDGVSDTDYSFTAQTGAISGSTLWRTVTPTPGTTFDIPLDSVVGIATSGYTYMRLFFTDPLPGGPTSQDYINYYDFEYDTANSTNFSPKLIVTYTIPGAPYVRSSASNSGNGTTVSPTLPTGWQPLDIVSITVAFQGGSGTTITTPTGWTLAPTNGRVDSTTAMSQAVFTRVMRSGDSAPTFTLGNTQSYTWESVASTSDFGQIVLDKSSGQSNVSSTTVSAPTLTPAQDNALILFFGAVDTGTSFSPASGYTEDQDVATGTATGGTIAAKTLYLMGGTLDNNFQGIQDGGTAPTDAAFATATGYQVGASSNATMSPFKPNTVQARTTFTSTAVPTGLGTGATNANAFKSPTTYLGSFASGNWTLSAVMRSITASIPTGMTIRSRWRVYASTDATGATSVRDLTSGTTQLSGAVAGTGNTTANMAAMSVTWAAPAITLTNEYLFFAHALEIVALSGTGNTRDAQFRQNSSSAITTTTFTPLLDITSEAAHLVQTTAAATGTVSATAGIAAVNIGQLVSIINAQQLLTQTFQPLVFY